jgi:hypothetical protein
MAVAGSAPNACRRCVRSGAGVARMRPSPVGSGTSPIESRRICCEHRRAPEIVLRCALMKGAVMGKSMDKKKETKKPAQKSAKEKKAAKIEKKKGK